jgi:hypothetical protein
MVTPEIVTSIGLAVFGIGVGGVVWGIRLEGRVNTHQTLFVEREKFVVAANTEFTTRLSRIEDKVDTLLSRERGERHGGTSHSGRV